MKHIPAVAAVMLSIAIIGVGLVLLLQKDFLAGPFHLQLALPWRAIVADAGGLALLGGGTLMLVSSLAKWGYQSMAAAAPAPRTAVVRSRRNKVVPFAVA